MTDASEALFVINLPAGTRTVPFQDIAKLIGIAITQTKYPDFDPDDGEADDDNERLLASLTRIDYEDTVKNAVLHGNLTVLNHFTLRPLDLPVGRMLDEGVVTVSELRRFVEGLHGAMHVAPTLSVMQPLTQAHKQPRIEPDGGDSLTPVIWQICYDLQAQGRKVTARPAMAELKVLAEKGSHPLVGVTAGVESSEHRDTAFGA